MIIIRKVKQLLNRGKTYSIERQLQTIYDLQTGVFEKFSIMPSSVLLTSMESLFANPMNGNVDRFIGFAALMLSLVNAQ